MPLLDSQKKNPVTCDKSKIPENPDFVSRRLKALWWKC